MKVPVTLGSLLTTVLLSSNIVQHCTGLQSVAYNVFTQPKCEASTFMQSHVLDVQPAPIGYCQDLGMGASAYNSIEILGCSSTCLCFKQYVFLNAESKCDDPQPLGSNVKMACFNKCLQDCNGNGCGDTAEPDSANTRLMLAGSGQICASPVADAEFVCATTGMIKDSNGNIIDDFANGGSGDPTAAPTKVPSSAPTVAVAWTVSILVITALSIQLI